MTGVICSAGHASSNRPRLDSLHWCTIAGDTMLGDKSFLILRPSYDCLLQLLILDSGQLFHVNYEAESIVACDEGASTHAFRALHRPKRGPASATSALDSFAQPPPCVASVLLVALRKCECQESDS